MRWTNALLHRLRSLRRSNELDKDLDDELRFHLENEIEADVARGVSPEEARRRARLGLAARRDECRDARGVSGLEHLWIDLKFAARQLRQNKGFTAVALVTLALGLGVSAAFFAYVDAALVKPLPYRDPQRLVAVAERNRERLRTNLSYQDFLDWRRLNTGFASMDAYTGSGFLVEGAAGIEPVGAGRVSPGFFQTLGVEPMLGRLFRADEALDSVILTHAAWQSRYGGARDIVGRKLILSGAPYIVVGVLAPSFAFAPLGDSAMWVPIDPKSRCHVRRSCHNLFAVGRLKPGVSMETAGANLVAIAKQLEKQYPDSNAGQGAAVQALANLIVGDLRPLLLVLLCGAALLLLIALVNVVSLLLVRAETRRREVAIRGALGASPGRLLSQFATEGALLAGAGTLLGLVLAALLIPALLSLVPQTILRFVPFLQDLHLNARVTGFALVLAVLAAGLFTVMPALHIALSKAIAALAEGSRGSAGLAWRRLGSKLVVVEFACALVLLTGAGLVGKSLYRLLSVDLGFQPDHLAMITALAPSKVYATPEQQIQVSRRVTERMRQLPGVTGVSIASTPPVSFNGNTNWVRIAGKPWNGQRIDVNHRPVSAGHFEVIGARLEKGRWFTEDDGAGKPRVVIINRTMAAQYFPGENPVGQRLGNLKLDPDSLREIVGVVEDIREGGLDDKTWPTTYVPFEQDPEEDFTVIVRSAGDPSSLLPVLGRAVKEVDRSIATTDEQTYTVRIHRSTPAYLHRSAAWLTGGFALVALLLSVVGLYGVVAYSVSQRTREIGVRMALGADGGLVRRLILRESAGLVALATVLGLGGALAASSALRGFFFQHESQDPALLAVSVMVLAGAALLASAAPARRASRVNPVEALRSE